MLLAKIWFYNRGRYHGCVHATRRVREGHLSIFLIKLRHAIISLVSELTWCILLRAKLSFTFSPCEEISSRFRLCWLSQLIDFRHVVLRSWQVLMISAATGFIFLPKYLHFCLHFAEELLEFGREFWLFRIKRAAAGDINLLRPHPLLLLDILNKETLANVLNFFDDFLSKLGINYILRNHKIWLLIVVTFFFIGMYRLIGFRFVFVLIRWCVTLGSCVRCAPLVRFKVVKLKHGTGRQLQVILPQLNEVGEQLGLACDEDHLEHEEDVCDQVVISAILALLTHLLYDLNGLKGQELTLNLFLRLKGAAPHEQPTEEYVRPVILQVKVGLQFLSAGRLGASLWSLWERVCQSATIMSQWQAFWGFPLHQAWVLMWVVFLALFLEAHKTSSTAKFV